jgi:hypothetical protein
MYFCCFIPMLPPMISHHVTAWWQPIYVTQDTLCGGELNGKDPFGLTRNMFSFQFFIHTRGGRCMAVEHGSGPVDPGPPQFHPRAPPRPRP